MLPKRYDPHEAEKRWQKYWEDKDIYAFDPGSDSEVYSIDTPPPTVSGKMHIGHAFSYAQEDFVARFQRMRGKNVFYPFGTDDNGLPTERLVEKKKKVSSVRMDRKEFREMCLKTVKELLPKFVQPWKDLAMSCDFKNSYSTIDTHAQKTSQLSFLDLYKKGLIYEKESPTTWCTTCRTAIAQAEFENVDKPSHFNDIVFRVGDEEVIIATTRPELIPSCVAILFHPDDERYKHLEGKFARVPLFGYDVQVIADKSVEKDKGTGILMCCTFGDKFDIEWWYKYKLPLKVSIGRDGKMNKEAQKYEGMKTAQAREAILKDLHDAGLLRGQKDITHAVNVHERCGTEIEFLNTRQWFIKVLENKEKLIEAAENIRWFPEHMKIRYEHWVKNLQWDWCISRQRHFGVPIPVWKKDGKVILPDEKDLPVDPTSEQPKGHEDAEPEMDVLDTWATSSVTPQIAAHWADDSDLFRKAFPMNMRPQAHDIIRTWAFYTITKAIYNNDDIPWKDIMISGHALDPKGKKMSKSRGNVVDPIEIMKKYNADCLRFWAAGAKLGDDLPFQEKDLVTGQKFITKLWNASKFAIMNLEDYDLKATELELMDRWILTKMNRIIKEATEAFERYEYSKTKLETDKFFWHVFCDNYLEIVKDRLYNPDKRGKEAKKAAQFTLYRIVLDILKIMAPIMPHITEEIYHLYFRDKEDKPSIHVSSWPEHDEKLDFPKAEEVGDHIVGILTEVRRYKTSKSISLKTPLEKIVIECDKELEKLLLEGLDDLKATTNAEEIEFGKGDTIINDKVMIKIYDAASSPQDQSGS